MKTPRLIAILSALLVGVLFLAAGCATNKQKWLSIFFDGVPPEGVTNQLAVVSRKRPPRKNSAVAAAIARLAATKSTNSTMTVHPPFGENKCEQCHETATVSLIARVSQRPLCFSCHKDFLSPMTVKHKPVDDGQCSRCHSPHESPNKKLLLKKGNALCLTCHNPLAKGPVKHLPVESGDCLDCHVPHGGPNPFLTKLPGKALCFDCHDDFAAKAKFTHAPAESGACTACHEPHSSLVKKLLKRDGGNLCYECHDDLQNKTKLAKSVHAPVENGECLSCHNPHAANEKFMLIKPLATLCLDCHEEKDLKAVKGHAGSEGKSCLQCHDPHASLDLKLLKAVPKKGPNPP